MSQGCAYCKSGEKSVRISNQVDICAVKYAYLPMYMPVETQRPEWCPGFEGKEIVHEKNETHENETEQQELFGFRRE